MLEGRLGPKSGGIRGGPGGAGTPLAGASHASITPLAVLGDFWIFWLPLSVMGS